jgi:hypothetical protein
MSLPFQSSSGSTTHSTELNRHGVVWVLAGFRYMAAREGCLSATLGRRR